MKKRTVTFGVILIGCCLIIFGTYKLMNMRTFQLFGGLISQVETNTKAIALTFDDGPTTNTEQLLPLLDKYNAKATFFLIGNELEKHPEQGRDIAKAGHQIGNHTYSHKRMVFKSPSFIKKEIEETDRLIRQTGYEGTIDFRPPNGKKLVALPYYLMKHQRTTVTWNLEPDTNLTSPSDKVDYVTQNAKPGSIILMHPMYDDTGKELQAIEQILQALAEEGYTFVTVNELRGLKS